VFLDHTSNGGEMLVLTRKTNQSIMIGDDIEVTVLAVARDKIRLGITAPREVPVFRKEVYLSIKGEENDEAGKNGEVSAAVGEALDELKGKSKASSK
jgi:carbon storage regulator